MERIEEARMLLAGSAVLVLTGAGISAGLRK